MLNACIHVKGFQTGHYSLQVLGDDACIGFCVLGDMIARYLKVSKISFGQDAPVPVLLRWKFCNALSMGKEHDRTCIRKRFVLMHEHTVGLPGADENR